MWIPQSELARAAGVTVQTVFNFERQKLVVTRPARRGGKKEYDVHASLARILADPKTRKKESVRKAYSAWCTTHNCEPYWLTAPASKEKEPEKQIPPELWSLEEAKRQKEICAAQLEKLKLEKEAGRYIEADVARATIEDIGIRTKKALLAIPDRISAVLAAEPDAFQVQRLLESELRGVLAGLAGDLEKAAPA